MLLLLAYDSCFCFLLLRFEFVFVFGLSFLALLFVLAIVCFLSISCCFLFLFCFLVLAVIAYGFSSCLCCCAWYHYYFVCKFCCFCVSIFYCLRFLSLLLCLLLPLISFIITVPCLLLLCLNDVLLFLCFWCSVCAWLILILLSVLCIYPFMHLCTRCGFAITFDIMSAFILWRCVLVIAFQIGRCGLKYLSFLFVCLSVAMIIIHIYLFIVSRTVFTDSKYLIYQCIWRFYSFPLCYYVLVL